MKRDLVMDDDSAVDETTHAYVVNYLLGPDTVEVRAERLRALLELVANLTPAILGNEDY